MFTVSFFLFYARLQISQPGLYRSIDMKLCTADRPDLGQVFSHGGGIVPGMTEFWASTGAIWQDVLLAEALVYLLPLIHGTESLTAFSGFLILNFIFNKTGRYNNNCTV